MNNVSTINPRLAYLTSCYSVVETEIRTWRSVLDTYEGQLSLCSDGERSEGPLAGIERATAELARLAEDMDELDRMWNEAIYAVDYKASIAA